MGAGHRSAAGRPGRRPSCAGVRPRGGDAEGEEPVDDAAAERGGFWGIYVPGNSTLVYPQGFAKRIPEGAKLKFQMHYTPNGTATSDQTRIGLIWAKEPPQHEIRVAGIVNARISIPPGAENHREEAVLRLPMDAQITGFLPHMHLRGKACKYEVTKSDGQIRTLLDIPRYDFNWQLLYRYFEPLSLHAGDTIRFTVWYDNSDKNPANPDPTKTVRWHRRSTKCTWVTSNTTSPVPSPAIRFPYTVGAESLAGDALASTSKRSSNVSTETAMAN